MKKVQIALVDDHHMFREGLKDLLEDQPDFHVVAEGTDGLDALKIVSEAPLDVLLIDLRLPNLGGVAAIRRIRETYGNLKIVVVSMYEDEVHKEEAILAGADAYHSKMDEAGDVVRTIRKLLKGEKMISQEAIQAMQNHHQNEVVALSSGVLTETEHQVLEQLCRGLNNKELAQSFFISESTLKNHLGSIFKKLGVKSRLEAVRVGLDRKLVFLE